MIIGNINVRKKLNAASKLVLGRISMLIVNVNFIINDEVSKR